jgi:hypothetical protein
MTTKQNQIQPETPATEPTPCEWGGLTVTEIDLTEGDAPQPVAADCPVGEPRGKRRAKTDRPPTDAPGATGGDEAPATPTPKTTKKRATSRAKAATAAEGKAASKGEKEAPKAAKAAPAPKTKVAPKKPTSEITMAELADSYAHHLEAKGKSAGTVLSYGIEMKTAVKHFGTDRKVASLQAKDVEAYFTSDRVTKKRSGEAKNPLGIDKTRRVLRLALQWLAEVGVLSEAPIPAAEKAPRGKK